MRQYPVYLLLFCKGHLTPCVFKGKNGGRGVFFSQNRVFPAARCGRSFSFFHGGRNLEKGVIVKLEDIVVVFDDEQVLKSINLFVLGFFDYGSVPVYEEYSFHVNLWGLYKYIKCMIFIVF